MCPTSRTSTRTLREPYSLWACPCSPPSPPLHPPRWCCPCSGSPAGVSVGSFDEPTVWSYPSPASASAASRMKAPLPWLSPSRTWIPARGRTHIYHTQIPPVRCPVAQAAPVCESTPRADPFLWTGSSEIAGTWRETLRNPEIMCCLWRVKKTLHQTLQQACGMWPKTFLYFLMLQTHPRGCSARTGKGFLLSETLSGSEADRTSYFGPQTATVFDFPGDLRHILGTSPFCLWRTSWTEGWYYPPCRSIDAGNDLLIKTERMNPSDFGDRLTFSLAPPAGWHFSFLLKRLLDGLPLNLVHKFMPPSGWIAITLANP